MVTDYFADVWAPYFADELKKTDGTARNQLPRGYKVAREVLNTLVNANPMQTRVIADVGCGKSAERLRREFAKDFGGAVTYYGVDPVHVSVDENLRQITEFGNGGADVVMINNVLNVIPSDDAVISVIECAVDALKDNGTLIVTVYEGSRLSHEPEGIKLQPTTTRDGYQRRQPIEAYLGLVQKRFPDSRLARIKGVDCILAIQEPID